MARATRPFASPSALLEARAGADQIESHARRLDAVTAAVDSSPPPRGLQVSTMAREARKAAIAEDNEILQERLKKTTALTRNKWNTEIYDPHRHSRDMRRKLAVERRRRDRSIEEENRVLRARIDTQRAYYDRSALRGPPLARSPHAGDAPGGGEFLERAQEYWRRRAERKRAQEQEQAARKDARRKARAAARARRHRESEEAAAAGRVLAARAKAKPKPRRKPRRKPQACPRPQPQRRRQPQTKPRDRKTVARASTMPGSLHLPGIAGIVIPPPTLARSTISVGGGLVRFAEYAEEPPDEADGRDSWAFFPPS